jgi:hypothetical protein
LRVVHGAAAIWHAERRTTQERWLGGGCVGGRRLFPNPRLRPKTQGKSFILNQLLSVTGGFRIGSTHRPCTKGLWMWSAPQACVDGDGRPLHLVGN